MDLLKEAGYADGKGIPKITYSTNDAGYHKVVAEYLQKAWGELGIDVDVEGRRMGFLHTNAS